MSLTVFLFTCSSPAISLLREPPAPVKQVQKNYWQRLHQDHSFQMPPRRLGLASYTSGQSLWPSRSIHLKRFNPKLRDPKSFDLVRFNFLTSVVQAVIASFGFSFFPFLHHKRWLTKANPEHEALRDNSNQNEKYAHQLLEGSSNCVGCLQLSRS